VSDSRDLGAGAAESAPTSPHATPGAGKTRTAGFWRGERVRRMLGGALVLSTAIHYGVVPLNLIPSTTLKFNDVDDELTIPVDLFDEAPVAAAERSDDPSAAGLAATKPGASDAGPVDASADANVVDAAGVQDAAPKREAGVADAAAPKPKPRDAGIAGLPEGGAVAQVVRDGGGAEGGIVVSTGPRDPGAMIGMAGLVSAGQVNVTLLLNMQVIRAHPTGAQLGPLFAGIPQWRDFMKSGTTKFDPVAGTDWILIYGPSLIHTDRDAVVVKYNASDDTIDETLAAIAAANPNAVVPDGGVPDGVTLGRADNGDRAYMRAPGKILVIVPPDKANTFAKALKVKGVNPRVRPTEALRLVVKDPHRQTSIPGAKFPQELKELRIWIEPHADGSADVFVEGDCTSEESAVTTAEALTDLLKRSNSGMVAYASGGLLNDAKVIAEGKNIKMHLTASAEQLGKVLKAVQLLREQ
jgi:hypothetical protein